MRISWLMWMPAGPTESKQTILYAGRGFCRGDGEGMHPEKTLLRERPENERTANYSAALVENAEFRWGKNNFFK